LINSTALLSIVLLNEYFKKYIRVQSETRPSDMIEFLYSQKTNDSWSLKRPQLILSVTGGAQKFTLPFRTKKAFKRGLIKAAISTGAWIITGGTNTGVMRLVGEAVADEFHKSKLTVLGIATWGKIALRDKMILSKNNDSLLNHFNEDKFIRENGNIYRKVRLFFTFKNTK
jgi:transient receptor potential cation channel subfamily M protein 7